MYHDAMTYREEAVFLMTFLYPNVVKFVSELLVIVPWDECKYCFLKGKIIKKQPQTLQYSGLFTFITSGNRLLPLDTTTTPSGFFQNLELVIIGTVCEISP